MGGDGRHVHAVHRPDGRVAAVEVAAVGAGSPVVRTFTNSVAVTMETERGTLYFSSCLIMGMLTVASLDSEQLTY